MKKIVLLILILLCAGVGIFASYICLNIPYETDFSYVGGGCKYRDVKGTAVITEIVDALYVNKYGMAGNNCPNKPVYVSFDFIPDNPITESLFGTSFTSKNRYLHVENKNPPKEIIIEKGIKVGNKYKAIKHEIKSGACPPVNFSFSEEILKGWEKYCWIPDPIPPSTSFDDIKKIARDKIYHDNKKTFYYSCPYETVGKLGEGKVDRTSCVLEKTSDILVIKNNLEWKEIMPIVEIAYCTQKKLKRCRSHAINKEEIIRAKFDLHNLVPVVSELKREIKKYKRGWWYSTNEVEEPADDIKGDIARILFSKREVHNDVSLMIKGKKHNKKLIMWDKNDPTSE